MSNVEGSVRFSIESEEALSYLKGIFGGEEYDTSSGESCAQADKNIVEELSRFNPKIGRLFNERSLDWVETDLKELASDHLENSESGKVWLGYEEYISQLFGEKMEVSEEQGEHELYFEGCEPFIGAFLAELLKLMGATNIIVDHDFFEEG